MSRYRDQIASAARAVTITSSTSFAWFGMQTQRLHAHLRTVLTPAAARSFLLYRLQNQLYDSFYCQGIAVSSVARATPRLLGQTPYVQQLEAANAGSGCWEDGWQVLGRDNSLVALQRGELTLWLPSAGYRSQATQEELFGDSQCLFPKDLPSISPGFYMALGNRSFTAADLNGIVRLYWNVSSAAGIQLMSLVTRALNDLDLPFRLKISNDPDSSSRCDAAILYFRKTDYAVVAQLAQEIHDQLGSTLHQAVPALTKPLAPGLALAEDPQGGESFGLQRCRMVAEGLLLAHEAGRKTPHEKVQAVSDRFAENSLSIDTPYLRPGSTDIYEPFNGFRTTSVARPVDPNTAPVDEGEVDFLAVAADLGRQISQAAIWDQDRCAWLGAALQRSLDVSRSVVYRALGPDLYSGSAGIALFLAELWAETGDPTVRVVAFGAIRHALEQAQQILPAERLGLYTGWPGIVLAGVRVGLLLGDEHIASRASELLAQLLPAPPNAEHDLLSGRAGSIVGLLALSEMLGDANLINGAAELGDELIAAADKKQHGYSWSSGITGSKLNLTGYSHGAAGIGYALLELAAVSGETRYQHAAEQAYEYERSWFNKDELNWPDLRTGGRHAAHNYVNYWCHGAPGIGLTRLRAYELLGKQQYLDEAILALKTTRQAIEAKLWANSGDFSLCHGLAGNAEVLIEGWRVQPNINPSDPDLARIVARHGIRNFAAGASSWPCGVRNGLTPSLMLGLAGIGHFYLRLHNPNVPSVLAIKSGR